MELRAYLYLISFLTSLFWVLWLLVVFLKNPLTGDFWVFSAFFLSLFLAITGSLTLFLFYLRRRFFKVSAVFKMLKTSVRQASLISLFIIGLLVFLSLSILNLWTISLIFVFIILLDLLLKGAK